MNQHLKQLMIDHGLHKYISEDCQHRMEKFAELIVQECIDTISDCSMEYCTRPQIVGEIKQHFGVEE